MGVGATPVTLLSRPVRVAVVATLLIAALLVGPANTDLRSAAVDAAPIEPALVVEPLAAGDALRVHVPGAEGGKTVIGQLTVARATESGYVTAYGCADGLPLDAAGRVDRSDLNYDGRVAGAWSNRLIVEADDGGDVCFYTLRAVEMIIDVNAVSFDTGISSFPNRRTDTRVSGGPIAAGGTLRVNVPEAVGSKTVIGQLTSARATGPGFVTAYACDAGIPRDAVGDVGRSDLNYDGRVTPRRSNRLIVQADADGDVCFHTLGRVELVVDVNGVADTGISSFDNRRTDTRLAGTPLEAGETLRVSVPEAIHAKTVVGQLTAAGVSESGYVTAYACDDGLPVDAAGAVERSDLNYNPRVANSRSNRLIVQADADGDVCFHTLRRVDLVVDVNGVSDTGITSFDNRRTDTRYGTDPGARGVPVDADGVPVWPAFEPLPAIDGMAALTGLPASDDITGRPIIAVKVDNYRLARPHIGLDRADAVMEVNVEGVSRFIALFHSRLPAEIGPVRSARTTDIDLLAAMNRPIFTNSGANPGVTEWIRSADAAGLLVDRSAQRHGCYARDPDRTGPHNLVLDPACVAVSAPSAGPARPLWTIDATWTIPAGVTSTPDTTFEVSMDGVAVEWTWDPGSRTYLRSQDGVPHVTETGTRISAATVVELASVHVPSPVDARSPDVITLGSGNARVHRDGRAIPAVWSRERPYDPFTFREATNGSPLPLDVGVTFLEFVRDR
jgi:hypothetical protein